MTSRPNPRTLTSSLIVTFCAGKPLVVSNMCVVIGLRPPPPPEFEAWAWTEWAAADCIGSEVRRCPSRCRLRVLVRRVAGELALCIYSPFPRQGKCHDSASPPRSVLRESCSLHRVSREPAARELARTSPLEPTEHLCACHFTSATSSSLSVGSQGL